MTRPRFSGILLGLLLLGSGLAPRTVYAQLESGPQVLIVTAHPDDEAMFAATIYRITHHLGGSVDLALVTDGAGGYRYSTLAEPIYGLDLTDEAVARQHLPAIRKKELMDGGALIGIRNYFFMDEADPAYTTNVDSVLTYQWDTEAVVAWLDRVMRRGSYDFVIGHLPIENFHGHHKAATILALRVAASLPPAQRPVVLGSYISSEDQPPPPFSALEDFPITAIDQDPVYSFDRNQPIGLDGRLHYKIIVNWLIAAHKSQGTMQLLMNRGDYENFWVFSANPVDAHARTRTLFDALSTE